MGYKMIKGNGLALLILIFIFTLVPVFCDNNSSINSTQSNPGGNVTGLYPPETGEIDSKGYFDIELTDHIVSIIVGILTILAILYGILKKFGYFKKAKPRENNHEDVPINSAPQNRVSNGIIKLPHPPNPNFTGRQEFLTVLAQSAAQAVSRPNIFALVGNGGMGKTHIALQHAHDPKNDFKYVWWLRSEEPATLLEDYISIARDLNLTGLDLRDTDQTVKTVKLWLEAEYESRWLLVFDNAQTPEYLIRFIPVAGSGQVVITSRQSVWDGMAETLGVKEFQRDQMQGESIDFLLKRTGKSDRKGAADLAQKLGDLPLALEQAGAYIKEKGISFSDYIARLKENRKDILSQGKPHDYPDSVATTWEISFKAVHEAIPAAGDLLNLFAFLAPDAIPRSLLEEAKHLPETLSSCMRNDRQLDDCIALLNRYSLISVVDNLISVHRLVQAVVQDRLSPEDQKLWAGAVLKMVSDAFSFDQLDVDTWEKCSKLSSHAFYASEHAQASPEEAIILLNNLGNYMHNRMELFLARSIFKKMLVIDEQAFGPGRPRVASILANFGAVLISQGDLDGAKNCFDRALAISEKGLVLDHRTVSSIFNNYGLVMIHQGNIEAAKICHERALAMDEMAFGKDHPSVAIDLNNLGLVLRDLDELEGAKKCFERALAINEKAIGKDHPSIAVIVNNIGLVLSDQGNKEEAKSCYEKGLAIDEKAFGKDHPRVATIVNNIGLLLRDLGDLMGAKKSFERALAIDEKAFGKDHPSVARDVKSLGLVLRDQGDLMGAKKCFERALAMYEKAFGMESPSVAICASNLGSVLRDQGDLMGAKKCFERALVIFEKRLGKGHPNSVLVRNNLRVLQENA